MITSEQILAEVALEVLTVAPADVARIVDEHGATGHHPVHVTVDLEALPGW